MREIIAAYDVFNTLTRQFSMRGQHEHIFVFVANDVAAIKDKRDHAYYLGRLFGRYDFDLTKIDYSDEMYAGFKDPGYDLFIVKSIGFIDNEEPNIFKILATNVEDPSIAVYLVSGNFHSEDIPE